MRTALKLHPNLPPFWNQEPVQGHKETQTLERAARRHFFGRLPSETIAGSLRDLEQLLCCQDHYCTFNRGRIAHWRVLGLLLSETTALPPGGLKRLLNHHDI